MISPTVATLKAVSAGHSPSHVEAFGQFEISRLGGDAADKQRDEYPETAGHAEPQAG